MVLNKAKIFYVEYRDSDIGTNEMKEMLCAIDRDIFIREHELPNKKNFTDEELQNNVLNYQINYTLNTQT